MEERPLGYVELEITLLPFIHQGDLRIFRSEAVEVKNNDIKLGIISDWIFIDVVDVD